MAGACPSAPVVSGLGPARALVIGGSSFHATRPHSSTCTRLPALFFDGRVSVDASGQFHTPAGAQLTPDDDASVRVRRALRAATVPSAQPLEMRGSTGNHLAALPDTDYPRHLECRDAAGLGRIPRYREMFEAAYPGTRFDDMTFASATQRDRRLHHREFHVRSLPVGPLPRRR